MAAENQNTRKPDHAVWAELLEAQADYLASDDGGPAARFLANRLRDAAWDARVHHLAGPEAHEAWIAETQDNLAAREHDMGGLTWDNLDDLMATWGDSEANPGLNGHPSQAHPATTDGDDDHLWN